MIKVVLSIGKNRGHFCFLPEEFKPLYLRIKEEYGMSKFILDSYTKQFGTQGSLTLKKIKKDILRVMKSIYPFVAESTYDRHGLVKYWLIREMQMYEQGKIGE